MAKFLFCLPRYHTNASPWIRLLMQEGHQVAIHSASVGPTENHSMVTPHIIEVSGFSRWMMLRSKNTSVAELRRSPGLTDYWAELKREAPDVVVIRGVTRWFSRVALVCAILQRRRVVIYDQEDVTPGKASTWIRRCGFRMLGIRHVTSRLPIDDNETGFGTASPLPFGCSFASPAVFNSATRTLGWPPRILMVAKYRERKGHLVMLEALARVAPVHDFTLTFCGEQASEADVTFCQMLSDVALRLGIRERLQFMNNVPHTKMLDVYSSHDLFVLPSLHEPAAVSPIEAAWSGCCVLLTRSSGSRGYVPDGGDFDFIEGESTDLARCISGAISSPENLARLRDKCRRHIADVAGNALVLSRLEGLLR